MTYHKDVGFPQGLSTALQPGRTALTYSAHARRAAADEHIRPSALPTILPAIYTTVEVDVVDRKVQKSVIRFKWNADYDLVMVVLADGFVKTVWLNAVTDTHKTLQVWRYARPAA